MSLILKLFSLFFISVTLYGSIIDDLYKINYVQSSKIEKIKDIIIENNSTIISQNNLYEIYSNRIINNNSITVETIDYYLNNNSLAVSYYELLIKLFYSYSVENNIETSKLYLDKILLQGVETNFNSFESILLTDIAINLKYPIKQLYTKNLCYIIDLDNTLKDGCLSNYFLLKNLNKEPYNLDIIPVHLNKYIKDFINRGD